MAFAAKSASDLIGASPPFSARPVSLAVRDYIGERKTHPRGSSLGLVVAVSGGADSLALAVAAADIAKRLEVPLIARVVDHRMREGSTAEARSVARALAQIGIDAAVLSAPAEMAQSGEGPEGSARNPRYWLLEEEARRWGAEEDLSRVDILLGHTMDDQAETVLLRLARGASPQALAAMRPVAAVLDETEDTLARPAPKIYRGRPLLSVRRKDTEAFCEVLGLEPVYDPTNLADGPWRTRAGGALPRSAVRERVLPALNAALEQDAVPALARVARLLTQDQNVLDLLAQTALAESLVSHVESGDHTVVLDVRALQNHPRAIRARVLRLAVASAGLPAPSSPQIDELELALWHEKNARGEARRVTLSEGGAAVRDGGLLRIERV